MSDNATAETPPNDEPQPAAPVAESHTSEAAAPPSEQESVADSTAPASEAPVGSPTVPPGEVPEAPAAPVTTDDWSIQPEPLPLEPQHAAKPARKTKPKAPKADADPVEEPVASAEPVAETDADLAPVPTEAEATSEPATDPNAVPTGTVTPFEEPLEPAPPENKKKWYTIKVQSGREDTIKAAILRKIAIEGLEEGFGQIMVPVDKVIEKRAVKVKDKKTGEYTTVERKVERKVKKFQGYIFAELEFNDRLLYLIRETSGVGDFLKLRPRVNDTPLPEPMTDAEVKQMLGEKVGPDAGGAKKVKIEFEKGDRVRIKEGSFKDSEGDVKDVLLPKDPTDPPKVIVTVTFWGRPLDVELEYWQVAKS